MKVTHLDAMNPALIGVTREAGGGSTGAHIRVEYDPEFAGGNYADVGRFKLIPLAEVGGAKDGVEAAFERRTGLPRSCIVHFCPDELFGADGEHIDV